jgi:cytochrome c oxidase subunit 4
MSGHDQKWQRLGDGKLLTEDAHTGLGHIVSIDTYRGVFISLVALTFITVWAAMQDFGMFNLVVAMGIASLKAGIVTLMFMHLNYESKIIWGIVIYPLFIFVLILGGTLGDATIKQQPIPFSDKPAPQESAAVVSKE